ncbi:MAG: arylsulfatase [bacterium]|nr:arylsulfatase [bacterium]
MKLAPTLLVLLTSLAAANDKRPNIVLILADDMGYTDVGCYGGEIQTPSLDRLARGGVRFTQFYNGARCCPTRASLMTGLYAHQAGIGLMTGDRGYDAYRGDLNRRCVTLAEALRPAGYKSYLSGKWHVTRHVGPRSDNGNWPLQRGFDRFYGTIIGAGSFYDPATLCRGNTFVTPENDAAYDVGSFYYTDAITDNALSFLVDHGQEHEDTPFFLYVSYTSAHWPMQAHPGDIAKYAGTYDGGYGPIRAARHARAVELGVIDERWKMAPGRDWEKVRHKQWEIRCMEVYAAMVDRMDQGIGRLVAELERQEILDDTLIVYLQDNGGCAEGFGRASNAHRAEEFDFEPLGRDGLQDKIWPPMQTRDGRFVRTGPDVMPGAEDTFIAYGAGWANVSNTPFRGFKHDGYEGGVATPFVVHWPDGITSERAGSIVRDPAHLIDVMPTFLAAADATYPKEHAGAPILPVEGISLLPALAGAALERSAPLGFEHHGNLALRDGRWKIVSSYRKDQPTRWELFDMSADRTELHDLSQQEPEKLRELTSQWRAWADRVGVVDWPFQPRRSEKADDE